MAFTGMLPLEVEQVVLVSEDTIYARERIDHAARLMMFQRPQRAGSAQQLLRMQLARPSPTFFEDRFVSVIPVLEVYSQAVAPPPPPPAQPFYRLVQTSIRLDEPNPEDFTHRLDHTLIHAFRSRQNVAFFLPYTFEIPDLNDNPWLEWVRPPPDPALGIFALRRQTVAPPIIQWSLPFYQAPRPRVEAEEDLGVHHHYESSYFALTRQRVAQPLGPWVQAVTEGYYLGVLRPKGDIFQLVNILDLANASVNYDTLVDNLPQQLPGWMQVLPGTPAALEQVQSLVVDGSTSPRRTVY